MKENEYQCAWCKGVFENEDDWTEEKQMEECKEIFGEEEAAGELVVVCDDCMTNFNNSIDLHIEAKEEEEKKCTLFIPDLDTGEKCLICGKTKPEH